jgi:hypothetical protein
MHAASSTGKKPHRRSFSTPGPSTIQPTKPRLDRYQHSRRIAPNISWRVHLDVIAMRASPAQRPLPVRPNCPFPRIMAIDRIVASHQPGKNHPTFAYPSPRTCYFPAAEQDVAPRCGTLVSAAARLQIATVEKRFWRSPTEPRHVGMAGGRVGEGPAKHLGRSWFS